MKNKKFLFICLLILAIGFAAVSTTLYISGNLVLGTNKNDFDIYFSGAIVDDEDKSNEVILSDKKHIEYETKELKKLGDRSVLEFEVTNNSTQYDAKVSISCILSDNEYITYTTDSNEYNIPAQTRESGKVIVELIKASTSILNPTISCELVSTAEERSATAETVITDSSYEITGTLIDEEGNILANKNLVVYSETPHYVTTDDYGFFYVNGLEKGSHEIYYINTEDATGKTKEEVKELAEAEARITTSSTKINFDNIKLNDFKINVEKEEEINITLDADTGSIDINTLKLNKYQKGSKLPTPTPKSNNYEFLGWYDGDKLITNNTIITSEMNLIAKWNFTCPYEVGKVWNFDYTGGVQVFNSDCSGIYKLETWGAQGATDSTNFRGGYGGYSYGNIFLILDKKIYIYVGGKGKVIYSNLSPQTVYGYPNGGSVTSIGSNDYSIGYSSGGGSTHILTNNNELKESTLETILIVSGGGGGSCNWWNFGDNGGNGGGYIGTTTSINFPNNGVSNFNPTGGTQTSGGGGGGNLDGYSPNNRMNGLFGLGGGSNNAPNVSGGGGGGFYGGGASWGGSGAGGSGYIGNSNLTNKAMYCYNCTPSSVESTKTISTKCTSETPIENCAKQGNGYARITLISLD